MQVPRHWRQRKQSYALLGETCPHCKAYLFPPRAVCPHCASAAKEAIVYSEQPVLALVEQMQPVRR